MARIPEQFIDDLISRSDIVALIDHRVPLQSAGNEFRACCPFHQEKTPSFYVSPAKQFYHCFGCGAHGTAIGFLMNYENLHFIDAVEALAAQTGMIVPQDAQQDTEQAQKARKEKLDLQNIVEQASHWYQTQLRNHPDAQKVHDYLKNRGLDGKIAKQFGIGFAPEGWDNVMKALGDTPKKINLLNKAGLLIEKETGGFYDRFRARVMFPIEDHRGKLIGFGGRVMSNDEPKYLNSPETALFHKGAELYGYFSARREMGKLDEALVVEGYMDVVGLAQGGIKHAVATLGTATTAIHLQRLFRAASKIIFCFDGDRAGRKAAWRALQIALPFMEDGRQIKFFLMPEGQDPDSLIREEGENNFRKRIDKALSLNEFLFTSLSKPLDLGQMDQRAKLAKLAQPLLQKLPQGSFKSMMYVRLSELVGVTQHESSSAPRNDAPPPYYETEDSNEAQMPARSAPPMLKGAVKSAIALLVQTPALIEIANEFELEVDDSDAGSLLLDQIIGMINIRPDINTAQLLERMRDHPQYENLSQLAANDLMLAAAQIEDEMRNLLSRVMKQSINHQIELLLKKASQNKLQEAENKALIDLYNKLKSFTRAPD